MKIDGNWAGKEIILFYCGWSRITWARWGVALKVATPQAHRWALAERYFLPDINTQRWCFPLTSPAPALTPHTAKNPCPCTKKEKGLHRHNAHTLFLKQAIFFLNNLLFHQAGDLKQPWASLFSQGMEKNYKKIM